MNHKQMFGQIVASWCAARGAFCSASPAKHTLFLISYVFLLAGFTDAVIWWMMGPMNGYTWQYYACYAVLSWSLWFFLGPKGLASEQTLIFESGRWFSLDLLPGGPSSAIAAHSLGRTFKGRGIVVWVSIYCAIYLNADGTFIGLMTALCSMILGTVFMTYASVMFRMWSARGYSAVTSPKTSVENVV